ncbi:MAG: orotidine-5'-phosphate decarboxylase [Rhodospirillaceae bacterium]
MVGKAGSCLFCAIDTVELETARRLAVQLRGAVGGLKLGLEFFIAHGPVGVRAVVDASGLPLFIDLKVHDIPNTAAGAVRAAMALKPRFLTIHTSGGTAMMKAAAETAANEAERLGLTRPHLLGVTVLTSLTDRELYTVGQAIPVGDQVARLAALAQDAGLDGVVCSPHEIAIVRAQSKPGFTIMVPGIRPASSLYGDQKRVMTPAQALAAGADYLVVGRPITQDKDPAEAARRIAGELQ